MNEARPCVHGEMKAHGEIGKDWCAGAMTRFGEPWRKELEWQMNLTPLSAGIAGGEITDDASASSASDSSAGSLAPVLMTRQEADARLEWYEASRCTCGGSPITLDPNEQIHLATCTAIEDFARKSGRYPWDDPA